MATASVSSAIQIASTNGSQKCMTHDMGCSVPDLLSPLVDPYKKRFRSSCIRHDFCYRHGSSTYCQSRKSCDVEFRNNMKRECRCYWCMCRMAAELLYNAARKRGASSYQTGTPCCEYKGVHTAVSHECRGPGCPRPATPSGVPCG
mmetsp:Transcript_11535/g.22146  ORF Transcript_11535/g.22146 Transcript_11535/m.22146 type:complete len:146 (-) Transcript_11535:2522-2959(-)